MDVGWLTVTDGECDPPHRDYTKYGDRRTIIHIRDLRRYKNDLIASVTFLSTKKLVNYAHLLAFYKYRWKCDPLNRMFWNLKVPNILQGSKYLYCGIDITHKAPIKGTSAIYVTRQGILQHTMVNLKDRCIYDRQLARNIKRI